MFKFPSKRTKSLHRLWGKKQLIKQFILMKIITAREEIDKTSSIILKQNKSSPLRKSPAICTMQSSTRRFIS
jgi:hypothetical protein